MYDFLQKNSETLNLKSESVSNIQKENVTCQKIIQVPVMNENYTLDIPKTSVQFQNCWKVIRKKPKEAYEYLMVCI